MDSVVDIMRLLLLLLRVWWRCCCVAAGRKEEGEKAWVVEGRRRRRTPRRRAGRGGCNRLMVLLGARSLWLIRRWRRACVRVDGRWKKGRAKNNRLQTGSNNGQACVLLCCG